MKTVTKKLQSKQYSELPRERLIHYGAEALSNAELLAILLRTGTKQRTALQVAEALLYKYGHLQHLFDLSVEELTKVKGIGQAKAISLLASAELSKRLAKSKLGETVIVRTPQDAALFMMEDLRHQKKEFFVALFLNTKNHITGKEVLSIGTLNASLVHPREVFRAAIRHSSASIICLHNHPSGDPTPSTEDIKITKRLVEAGNLIGIDVLDHIIIGDGRFISLKEQGHL